LLLLLPTLAQMLLRGLLAFLCLFSGRGATVQVSGDGQTAAQCLLETDAASLSCLDAQPPADAALIRATLEGCMQRGFWKCCAALASLSKARGIDVSNTVSIVSGNIRRELQTLSDSIGALKTEGIAPAYECVLRRTLWTAPCGKGAPLPPSFAPRAPTPHPLTPDPKSCLNFAPPPLPPAGGRSPWSRFSCR